MSVDVTAVITTHARPHDVRHALASVLAEAYRNIECVIVDDGGTFELPPGVPAANMRVVRGRSLGVARARNMGLAAARGEFVIFLDDDDVVLPNRIDVLLAEAKRFGADLCYGLTRRVVVNAAAVLPHVPTGFMVPGAVGFRDLLACAPHVNAVLVRTSVLRSAGGFDAEARHFDDWSAWLRVADRDAVVRRVNEVVAEWRIHSGGLSAEITNAAAMKPRLLALFTRLQEQLSEGNRPAVAAAQFAVALSEIQTYDDYVQVMRTAHAALPIARPRSRKGIAPRAPKRAANALAITEW